MARLALATIGGKSEGLACIGASGSLMPFVRRPLHVCLCGAVVA